MHLILVLNLKR